MLQQIQIQSVDDGANRPSVDALALDTLAVRTIRRIPIRRWAIALAVGDLGGALAIAWCVQKISALTLEPVWAVMLCAALVWALVAHALRLYDPGVLLGALRLQLVKTAAALGLVALLGLLLVSKAGAFGNDRSAAVLVGVFGAVAWMWTLRVVWHHFVRAALQQGRCVHRALLLTGSPEGGAALRDFLEGDTMGAIRIAAVAPIPGGRGDPLSDWIENLVRTGHIDRVFIAGFKGVIPDANALVRRLSYLAVDVTLMPDLDGIDAPALRVDHIGPRPVIDVNLAPLSAINAASKRIEDLVIVVAVLPLFVLVTVLIAIAIKLDSPGPVFFRQWRAGFHDRRFRMWKFRTMYHDMRDEGASQQTRLGDNRVTRVGRILRKTSLDEMPQILNVLMCEMSIVGPRPHALGMTATGQPLHEVATDYPSRHRVKPGITGWAQVCACRGEVDSAEKLQRRVMLDCYYIEHWSLAFDLWIILRTAGHLMMPQDAY